MNDKSSKHGGQRKGAGRPKKPPTKVFSTRVPAKLSKAKVNKLKQMVRNFVKENTNNES